MEDIPLVLTSDARTGNTESLHSVHDNNDDGGGGGGGGGDNLVIIDM